LELQRKIHEEIACDAKPIVGKLNLIQDTLGNAAALPMITTQAAQHMVVPLQHQQENGSRLIAAVSFI